MSDRADPRVLPFEHKRQPAKPREEPREPDGGLTVRITVDQPWKEPPPKT
jgi:hypothetical protein